MRIALVVPGGVDPSGTERVIPVLLWYIERLARRHSVDVFALRQPAVPPRYSLLGATVHAARGKMPRWDLLSALRREHLRAPFDLLHAWWGMPTGTLAVLAGRVLRRPVLVHLAGGELQAMPDLPYGGCLTWRGRAQIRLAMRGARAVTVAAPAMRDAARAWGVEAEIVPLGVALDRWPMEVPRPRPAGRPFRVLHVASLNRVKDQPTLLAALAALDRQGVPFVADLVGEDTLGGEVQARAARLGLDRVVTFHGFLPHDRLRPLFLAADLHVHASRHEGGEVVTLEAAVAGVPTVGTAVGHTAAWNPDAALAVPTGDADALAAAIATLASDDDRRIALAHEAQRRAVSIDADHTVESFERLYQRYTR